MSPASDVPPASDPTAASPAPTAASGASAQPALRLDGIHKRLGGRDIVVDLHLDVAPGELVTLLGPSGCGKTTTLRMVAGFLKPDRGRVLVDGRDVTPLNPEKRPSAMVFQSYALWPHMTVFKNVAFPLRLAKVPGAELTRRVEAALDMVGLMHHRDSRPARISGGEQQRVALARALVQEPKLLLLDEPLSNLDARLRVKVREEIRDIQQRLGITTVLVTHDQEEALSISDRVAVMKDGRIEQLSPPAELYADPRSEFVARFVGSLNTFDGRLVERADGLSVAAEPGVVTAVRPEDVVILDGASDQAAQLETQAAGATAARPVHAARVLRVVPHGPYAEVMLDVAGHRLSAFRSGSLPAQDSQVTVRLRRPMVFVDGKREQASDS